MLGAVLASACHRAAPRPPVRVDAAVRADASARVDVPVDASARADAPADAAARSTIYLVTHGAEMVRPGATVRLAVYRLGGPDVDVTAQAQLRVEPPTGGEITADHVFHARGLGRHFVVATVGAEETRSILDVSTEVPAGLTAVPMIAMSAGLGPVVTVRFRAERGGLVGLDVGLVNATLALSGRRGGRTFPMVVPIVRGAPGVVFDGHRGPAAVEPVEGELVLDRWLRGRLDGHAVLRTAARPLRFTFSLLLGDPAPLQAPLPPT